jgi:hypothetical protein
VAQETFAKGLIYNRAAENRKRPNHIGWSAFCLQIDLFNCNLNDDRQGEGGTLAVINVNNTTRYYSMQVFCIRK